MIYTMISSLPSNQVVEPSLDMDVAMNAATPIAASSIVVKMRFIPLPNNKLMNTRTGATNKAICKLLPTAISTAAPILFFKASITAALCSAALPIMATTKAPTNSSERPKREEKVSSVCTSHSLINATMTVAIISKATDTSPRPYRLLAVTQACVSS